MNLGPFELGIILVIVIMIFGLGRLPEVGGAVGKTIKEFRNNMGSGKSVASELDEGDGEAAAAPERRAKAETASASWGEGLDVAAAPKKVAEKESA